MRSIGSRNTSTCSTHSEILDLIKNTKDKHNRSLNELARAMLKKKGHNPNDAKELSKMLGKLHYHLSKLKEAGEVERTNLRNATIYTIK